MVARRAPDVWGVRVVFRSVRNDTQVARLFGLARGASPQVARRRSLRGYRGSRDRATGATRSDGVARTAQAAYSRISSMYRIAGVSVFRRSVVLNLSSTVGVIGHKGSLISVLLRPVSLTLKPLVPRSRSYPGCTHCFSIGKASHPLTRWLGWLASSYIFGSREKRRWVMWRPFVTTPSM